MQILFNRLYFLMEGTRLGASKPEPSVRFGEGTDLYIIVENIAVTPIRIV